MELTATYPVGKLGDTAANLEAAATGEHEEWRETYPHFAEVAKQEGFPQVAAAFTMIARAEQEHEARYRKLLGNVQQQKVFKQDQPVRWKCQNCGYIHEGTEAPAKCPACLEARAYFEIAAENY